jgi:hypothetical protein
MRSFLNRAWCRVQGAVMWGLKGAFLDGKGTVSLTRCALVFVAANVFAIVWLSVAWVGYVTLTGQMEAAAPLAGAVFNGVAAVLSSSLVAVAGQYVAQIKWGSGGVSAAQIAEQEAGPTTCEPAAGEQGPGGI